MEEIEVIYEKGMLRIIKPAKIESDVVFKFKVLFSPKSYKQIKSFNEELKERIKKAAIEIGDDPWEEP